MQYTGWSAARGNNDDQKPVRGFLCCMLVLLMAVGSVIVLIFPQPGMAAQDAPTTLHVVGTHKPPLRVASAKGNTIVDGTIYRMMERIAEQLHVKLVYTCMPIKRALLELRDGRADVYAGLLKRADRERYLHFIEPAYVQGHGLVFLTRKGDRNRIRTYDDLYRLDRGIAVVLGKRYFKKFDNDLAVKKDVSPTEKSALNKLILGRVDAAIMSDIVAEQLATEMRIGNEMVTSEYSFAMNDPSFIALSKKSPWMNSTEEISRVLEGMLASGEIQQILHGK